MIADDPTFARSTVDLPLQFAVVGIDAVEIAIIGGKVNAILVTHRGKAHRTFRVEAPNFFARFRVIGGDRVRHGGRDVNEFVENDRLRGNIEL